jgi:hypothetical protein
VGEFLKDVQRHGVIEERHRPWSSPVIWKNGDLCFCVDYRKLNDVTKKDCFPLPWINNTLDMLAEAQWFTTQDLKNG